MFRQRSHMRLYRSLIVLSILACLSIWPRTASGHPLGNFTINLYSRLEIAAERIDITYVLDMAEIPTYQELLALGGDQHLDTHVRDEYLDRKVDEISKGIQLVVDGHKQDLQLAHQELSLPPGQGGLATLRILIQMTTQLPQLADQGQREVQYADTNYTNRIGWREIVARPVSGAKIVRSNVKEQDLSNELRSYPQDMLESPLDIRSAHIFVEPGIASPSKMQEQSFTAPQTDQLAALITAKELSPQIVMLAMLIALGLGAVHALSPGHGKSIVGAYLIGSRGTIQHALFLGMTVTATHTIGVFALGLLTLYASWYIMPEQLYPWLGICSGLLVLSMGLTLMRQRLLAATNRHDHHDHNHDHDHHHAHDHAHDHGHDHDHDHAHYHSHGGHSHSHLPPGADGSPITWRSLLALGISGGLLPCPSALIVMLSAISLHRIGLGLMLIIAFSLGLASVLSGIGILFLYGGRLLSRITERRQMGFIRANLRWLPFASAAVVVVIGVLMTAQAVMQAGIFR